MEARATGSHLTEDVLYGIPDDDRLYELQAGVLVSEPRPFFEHGEVQSRLAHLLGAFVTPRRLGSVTTESGFLLARDPDTIRGPDVAFVTAERVAALDTRSRFFPGAPDLAIEIVSPSNSTSEIHAKVADYLAAGARLVWVVDPETKVVTTYRSLLAPVRLAPDATLDGEDVLPGFSIPCARLFE